VGRNVIVNVFYTNSFKKDLKKAKAQRKNFELLDTILELLSRDKLPLLPLKYKNHKLIVRIIIKFATHYY